MIDTTADRFHAHLDVCQQCREHPFQLCAYGMVLINVAATEIAQAGGSTVAQEPEPEGEER